MTVVAKWVPSEESAQEDQLAVYLHEGRTEGGWFDLTDAQREGYRSEAAFIRANFVAAQVAALEGQLDAVKEIFHGDGIYYVPQERAFAPGIVKDWPAVIRHPKDRNGRLVKRCARRVASHG